MWTLDESLGFTVNRTARAVRRGLDGSLVKHGLTASQYIVLERLWQEDGTSLTELGESLYFDNPTLTGIIDRMERGGFLQRQRDGDDRRVVRVFLTPVGRNLHETLGGKAEETDREAVSGLTEDEQRMLINTLNRIWKRMNEVLD